MAFLDLLGIRSSSILHILARLCVADLLHGELDASNLQDVPLNNLVVHLLILVLKAAHYQVHGLRCQWLLLRFRRDIIRRLLR